MKSVTHVGEQMQQQNACGDHERRQKIAAAHTAAQSLRIAAVPTAAESFVPGLMQAFGQAHLEAELTLVVGNNEEVLARVLQGVGGGGLAPGIGGRPGCGLTA